MRLNYTATAVVLLLCSMVPCFSQGLTRADRPEVKVGDNWVFQGSDVRTGEKSPETTHTVSEIGPDKIIVTTGAGTRTYTRDWNLVEVKTGEAVTAAAKPYWPTFQFPLEVGKKWEQQYESMTRGGERTYTGQRTMQVMGVETVIVPAGKFETFKIRIEGYYNGSSNSGRWNGTLNETLWYSPAAKRNVKRELEERSGSYYNHRIFELKSLTLAQ